MRAPPAAIAAHLADQVELTHPLSVYPKGAWVWNVTAPRSFHFSVCRVYNRKTDSSMVDSRKYEAARSWGRKALKRGIFEYIYNYRYSSQKKVVLRKRNATAFSKRERDLAPMH